MASVEAGRDACEFAEEELGLVLDDWQRWLVEMLLAERDDGRLASSSGLILVPRQNGKNVVLAVVEMYGLCVVGLRRQVHSAHLTDTAAEHMKWLKELAEENDLTVDRGGYLQVYESNGKERFVNIETRGELSFNTRTKSTKRGASPQRIVFDEALFLTDDQMQAMTPSLGAQSLNVETYPQIIYTSSAPILGSDTLSRLRREGLAGTDPQMFVADWGCDPGVDVRDRENWYAANPGLGIRIAEEFLASQVGRLTPEAFAIEHLGVAAEEDGSIALPGWLGCLDVESQMTGLPSLAVDVSPDLAWTSIAVAGARADGLAHLEVVDRLPGTGAAVSVVAKIARDYNVPVHLEAKSPAAGLAPGLRAEGVEVVEIGPTDAAKACTELAQAVAAGTVRHRGQGPLDAAVAGAAVRVSGDAWTWTRRSSAVDISALVAVTNALHAYVSRPAATVASGFWFPDGEDD